jgi:hypothetical protein
MKFMCWEIDDSEGSATEIDDAYDPSDAAATACEKWHDSGRWDSTSSEIEVCVRDESGALWLVDVAPEYDISFYGGKPIAQVLANIENLEHFMATDETWGPQIQRYSFLIGTPWSALTPDERRERGDLRDKLKRVGFDPGWVQAT